MIPTAKQWNGWTLPSRLTAIGAYVGIAGLLIGSASFFIQSGEHKGDPTERSDGPADKASDSAAEASALTYLSDDDLRRQLDQLMVADTPGDGVVVLAYFDSAATKHEECTRLFSFALNNHHFSAGESIARTCWTAADYDDAMALLAHEQLKDHY